MRWKENKMKMSNGMFGSYFFIFKKKNKENMFDNPKKKKSVFKDIK